MLLVFIDLWVMFDAIVKTMLTTTERVGSVVNLTVMKKNTWRFPKSWGYPKSSKSSEHDLVLKPMVLEIFFLRSKVVMVTETQDILAPGCAPEDFMSTETQSVFFQKKNEHPICHQELSPKGKTCNNAQLCNPFLSMMFASVFSRLPKVLLFFHVLFACFSLKPLCGLAVNTFSHLKFILTCFFSMSSLRFKILNPAMMSNL